VNSLNDILLSAALPISLGTLAGILFFLEVGRRVGLRRRARLGEATMVGTGAIEGAVFGLLGLLIAFTFSGAASRFDSRRHLIAQEANDIGTAWLRLDLLPTDSQPALRDLFRKYLDSRLETYRRLPDLKGALEEMARSQELQQAIWSQAVAACDARGEASTRTLVLTSLNSMIDITTTRTMAARIHPPSVIFILLIVMVLACSFLAGHAMSGNQGRPWAYGIGFAVVMALAIYVILDVEYPRAGMIRMSDADQVLVDLREEMN